MVLLSIIISTNEFDWVAIYYLSPTGQKAKLIYSFSAVVVSLLSCICCTHSVYFRILFIISIDRCRMNSWVTTNTPASHTFFNLLGDNLSLSSPFILHSWVYLILYIWVTPLFPLLVHALSPSWMTSCYPLLCYTPSFWVASFSLLLGYTLFSIPWLHPINRYWVIADPSLISIYPPVTTYPISLILPHPLLGDIRNSPLIGTLYPPSVYTQPPPGLHPILLSLSTPYLSFLNYILFLYITLYIPHVHHIPSSLVTSYPPLIN